MEMKEEKAQEKAEKCHLFSLFLGKRSLKCWKRWFQPADGWFAPVSLSKSLTGKGRGAFIVMWPRWVLDTVRPCAGLVHDTYTWRGPAQTPIKHNTKIWTKFAHSRFFAKIFAHLVKRLDTPGLRLCPILYRPFKFWTSTLENKMVSICPLFKWLGCPVLKWHSKTRPFGI